MQLQYEAEDLNFHLRRMIKGNRNSEKGHSLLAQGYEKAHRQDDT